MRKHYAIHASNEAAKLRSGLLKASVSAAALCLFGAGTAWAQTEGAAQTTPAAQDAATTQDGQTEDEIVVQGYRQSLQSAQQIKRNSDVIVDSVTAEDIGALPDRSVTETLQRIPGVAINRFAAGVDPDHFSVEGSGVVVRGLTYVRSEFNGREAFSANNGRALSFADVPSELMGGVDVFKSPSADRIEGGIAGVVNLRTRKPFDAKGLVLAASAEMNYGDFQKDPSANLNAVISNRWETGIGEIGFLASASYSNLKSRADRLQVSSFRIRNLYSDGDVNANGGTTVAGRVLFPRGAAIGTQEFDRTRYGYSAAAQWRSNDGSMEAVFQFLRSDARQAWNEHTVEIATDNVSNNGDSRRVPGSSMTTACSPAARSPARPAGAPTSSPAPGACRCSACRATTSSAAIPRSWSPTITASISNGTSMNGWASPSIISMSSRAAIFSTTPCGTRPIRTRRSS